MEGRAVPKERERLTNFQLQFKNGTGGEFLLSDSMTPHPNDPPGVSSPRRDSAPNMASRVCVVSWGGAEAARGWRGPSGGAGPVGVVAALPSTMVSLAASRGSAALDASGRVFTWGFNDR